MVAEIVGTGGLLPVQVVVDEVVLAVALVWGGLEGGFLKILNILKTP